MAPNLPPSITVNSNLASTLRNFIKANSGRNVSEAELNSILQKVAIIDEERDNGKREGGSIFSGGNKYFGGSANDFVVKQGQQIQLSAEEFNKIFKGYIDPVKTQETETPQLDSLNNTPTPAPDLKPNKPNMPDKIDLPASVKKQETEALLDSIDGKIIERQVNGTKQNISVATVDGQKVRQAVNEDGSLGEMLVTVSTAGKNKYITQSEMDNRMRAALGLAQNEEIPKDIKGEFVNIGGSPVMILKKDGKTMDQAQIKEYVAEIQKHKVDKFDANANPPLNAPVTGPSAKENPEYDAAVRKGYQEPKTQGTPSNNEQLEKYLAKDTSYQVYNQYIIALDTEIKEIEQKYGFKRGEPGNANLPKKVLDEYNKGLAKYEKYSSLLEQYKTEMENWKDGPVASYENNNKNFNNIERITLTNGEHAWKSDEGVFYPFADGKIGGKKVPKKLIPTSEPSVEKDKKVDYDGRVAYADINQQKADENKNVYDFVSTSRRLYNQKNGMYNVRGFYSSRLSYAKTAAENAMRGLTRNKDEYIKLSNQDPSTLTEDNKKFLEGFKKTMEKMELQLNSSGNFENIKNCKY